MNIITYSGPYIYFAGLVTLIIMLITCRTAYLLFIRPTSIGSQSTEHLLTAIPVLGAASVAAGLAHTTWGIRSLLQAVLQAKAIAPAIIMGGITTSLIPLLISLILFSLFSFIWFLLNLKYKQVLEELDG